MAGEQVGLLPGTHAEMTCRPPRLLGQGARQAPNSTLAALPPALTWPPAHLLLLSLLIHPFATLFGWDSLAFGGEW